MREQDSLSSFLDRTYLTVLRSLQNQDGGWGFTSGCQSRIEPTAWALLALQEFAPPGAADDSLNLGYRFLIRAQLEDGSWTAAAGQREGCWVTSLACWALLTHPQYSPNLINGLRWLNDDRPGDSGFWFRLARKLFDRQRISTQSASFSGWSWTPHTASWVEPTCYALIVQHLQTVSLLPEPRLRCELAEAMLYDRMCPGGGWNCGNPMVYGVAGQPQVGPTVWALIALREYPQRPENQESVGWLERNQPMVQGPESVALTQLGLGIYGRRNSSLTERLRRFQESGTPPWSVPAIAWGALALSETSRWLSAASIPIS